MEITKVHITSDGHGFDTHVTTEDGKALIVRDLVIVVPVDNYVQATMTVLQPELDVTLELVDKAQLDKALAKLVELERLCETRRAYNVSLVWEIEQLRAGTLPSGECETEKGGEVKPPGGLWQEPVDFGAGPLTPEEVNAILSKRRGEVRVAEGADG